MPCPGQGGRTTPRMYLAGPGSTAELPSVPRSRSRAGMLSLLRIVHHFTRLEAGCRVVTCASAR